MKEIISSVYRLRSLGFYAFVIAGILTWVALEASKTGGAML